MFPMELKKVTKNQETCGYERDKEEKMPEVE